jgi:hypothetical protein
MHTVTIDQYKLELSESSIRYGGYEIPLDQVRGLNVIRSDDLAGGGSALPYLQPIYIGIALYRALVGPLARRTSIAPTRFIGVRSDNQNLRINCGWAFAKVDELDAFFDSVFNPIWQAVGKRLTAQLISELERGQTVTIGGIGVCRDGVWLDGPQNILFWKNKPVLVPWNDIKITGDETELCIESISDASRRSVLTINNVENATVLDAAIRHLLQDGNWKKLAGRANAHSSLN